MRHIRSAALALMLAFTACGGPETAPADAEASATHATAVRSLSGKLLLPPSPIPDQHKLEADLAAARANLKAHSDDPDALIWVARRLGYLWRYREAIALLDQGIERWPDNPRLYRHRGHRFITVREFARAQADLERAAELIAGTPDEIEPDGMPNAAGLPRTTLAYNIWYHLGLARYLQADYAGAVSALDEARAVADNDDAIIAVTDWLWMTHMRLGAQDTAAALLGGIRPDMELLENDNYHRRLLMYKGVLAPGSLFDVDTGTPADIATQGYGVGNYYLVTGEPDKAKAVFERIIAGPGWNAFGYIAAEADLQRMQ